MATAISFFAGAGGLDTGIHQAGIRGSARQCDVEVRTAGGGNPSQDLSIGKCARTAVSFLEA